MEEHKVMLACPCSDPDRLTVICLGCGKVHAPDPSWVLVGFSVFYLACESVRLFL